MVFDPEVVQGSREQATQQLMAVRALAGTPRSVRPSSRLPGFGVVVDISEDECIKPVTLEFDNITKGYHYNINHFNKHYNAILKLIEETPGLLLLVALPSKPLAKQKHTEQVLHQVISLIDKALDQGGEVTFQAHFKDVVWLRPEMFALQHLHGFYASEISTAAGRLHVLSSWLEPASHLLALGRSIDRDEESSHYGKPLVQTREYLLRNLLTARFGFADPAPAMACTPSVSVM